jgi:hypothetical protein
VSLLLDVTRDILIFRVVEIVDDLLESLQALHDTILVFAHLKFSFLFYEASILRGLRLRLSFFLNFVQLDAFLRLLALIFDLFFKFEFLTTLFLVLSVFDSLLMSFLNFLLTNDS